MDRMAYRGYLLQRSLTGDVWYISRDGFSVGSALIVEQAMETVDALLDGEKEEGK